MLAPDLEAALNEQLSKELYSSYLYLAMAAHFEAESLAGAAAWMRVQADEERLHAMRFFDHVADRGGRVRLQAIDAPPAEFGSPLHAFERALEHERMITGSINALYERSDRATAAFLDWFVTEQIEEEKNVEQIVRSLELAGDDGPAILLIDRELGARGTPAPPAGA